MGLWNFLGNCFAWFRESWSLEDEWEWYFVIYEILSLQLRTGANSEGKKSPKLFKIVGPFFAYAPKHFPKFPFGGGGWFENFPNFQFFYSRGQKFGKKLNFKYFFVLGWFSSFLPDPSLVFHCSLNNYIWIRYYCQKVYIHNSILLIHTGPCNSSETKFISATPKND